jgi:hypothetical protein
VRIKRITGTPADQWEVTTRSGTKLIYQAVSTWGTYNAGDPAEVNRATNYRWLLAPAGPKSRRPGWRWWDRRCPTPCR